MTKEMVQRLAADRHVEPVAVGEIGLHRFARDVFLGEKHNLVRPFGGAPVLDAPLQGPDLARVVLLGLLFLKPLKQGFGLQLGGRSEHLLDLWPIFSQGVLPSPIGPFRELVGRQNPGPDELPACLAVHTRLHRGHTDPTTLGELFHKLPHLGIRD